MKPFLDAAFLATLLLKAPGRKMAWELVQAFDPPHFLTHLHILLIEHMFLHAGSAENRAALVSYTDWKRHWEEGVFQIELLEWLPVLTWAIDLSRRSAQHQAKPLHYLLAASAAATRSTHFLSFDSRTRFIAELAGLHLLPERL